VLGAQKPLWMPIFNAWRQRPSARGVYGSGQPLRALVKNIFQRQIVAGLYRNIKDWATLDEFDVTIHFVKEGVTISRTTNSCNGIKVLMARTTRRIGEETLKGMTEKARAGIYPSAAPTGYQNVEGQAGSGSSHCTRRGTVITASATMLARVPHVTVREGKSRLMPLVWCALRLSRVVGRNPFEAVVPGRERTKEFGDDRCSSGAV